MPQSADPGAFKDFEHAGWQGIPRQYHEGFGALTTQAIEPLLDAAGVRADARVLDVASGPGYVAAAAARRGARVTGVDFSAAMVEEAKRRFPGVEFAEGDAESLPFEDARFDAVLMNFGVLHLARPEQAIAEAARVLRPGGRFAFTVWAKPERALGFRIVLDAVQARGKMNVALPPGPPFFRFSDPGECARALQDAGFHSASAVEVSQTWRLPSPEALFEVMGGGTVRTAGLLRAQTAAARAAIRDEVARSASAFRRGAGIELPMPAVLASATK